MFVLQADSSGENIINEDGDFMVLDTDTNTTLFIPSNQIEFIQRDKEPKRDLNDDPIGNDGDSEPEEEVKDPGKWIHEDILYLISLYKKYEKLFESGIKKRVWQKITNEMNCKTKKKYNIVGVENKWKSLKRTYKNIKIKSSQSGSQRKFWEYFTIMDEILGKRPEIIPQVVASSSRGVVLSETAGHSETENIETLSPKTPRSLNIAKRRYDETSPENENNNEKTFFKKKNFLNVNDRHKEKMKRQDKFLELFEKMVEKM